MTETENQLQCVLGRINNAANAAQRAAETINLVAVSKTWPAEAIRKLAAQGQRHFGENYLQEALRKKTELTDLDLIWHFIGPIQSNKTRDIAEQFDWVHTLDRLKVAQRLSTQRPADKPPLNVCIQINIDDESSKSGIHPTTLFDLADAVMSLPHLKLRGLMVIPSPQDDMTQQRLSFHRTYQLFVQLKQRYACVDTLSMGMSGDLEAAILEGATLVRVGSALFGQRPDK